MCFLSQYTVNCCSLHWHPFRKWIGFVSESMICCEMLPSMVQIESCSIWQALTKSAVLKNSFIGNNGVLIGFLPAHLPLTISKQSLHRPPCASLGGCLILLVCLFRVIFCYFCFGTAQNRIVFSPEAQRDSWRILTLYSSAFTFPSVMLKEIFLVRKCSEAAGTVQYWFTPLWPQKNTIPLVRKGMMWIFKFWS